MELLQRRKFSREFLNGYNEKMHPQIISRVFEIGLLTLKKNYNKILFTKEELDEIIRSFNEKDYVEILPLPSLKKKEKSNNQKKVASPSPKHNCYLNAKFNNCPYLKTKIINKRKLYDKYLLNPNFTTQNSAIYPYWWWNNKEDKNEEPKDNLNVEENYNDNNEYYNNNEVYEYNKNDNLEYININEGEEEENNYQNYPQRQEYENDAMNYYLGQFFINMGGDYEKYFNKMDKTTPLFSFAQMYSAEGTDSIEKLKDILDIQPLFVPAINRLVAKYTGLGDKKAALRIINNALKNENLPDLGRAYLVKRRALVHLLFNDLNRAQADIHEASKLTVTDSEILTIQARIWSAQKREIENAYDYAMTMVKRDPTDIMAWDTLAVVVAAREGNDAALDILERVGRSANTCSSLFEHLGDAYSNSGNKKMARDAYMRAIELSSDGLSVAPNIQKKLRRLK